MDHLHTLSIRPALTGMEVKYVIGGKLAANMFKDGFLSFEDGASYLLGYEDETTISLIGTAQENLSRSTAVRDPSSGELMITIEGKEFRILPSSQKWMFSAGSDVLLGERRVGILWSSKSYGPETIEFYIDLPKREMVLIAVLVSETMYREETGNGENL